MVKPNPSTDAPVIMFNGKTTTCHRKSEDATRIGYAQCVLRGVARSQLAPFNLSRFSAMLTGGIREGPVGPCPQTNGEFFVLEKHSRAN